MSGESIWKALLVAAISVLPVFIILYQEDPQFRWTVDELIAQKTYRLRLQAFKRSWYSLPGWRQELWNHFHPVPLELREPQPDYLVLE